MILHAGNKHGEKGHLQSSGLLAVLDSLKLGQTVHVQYVSMSMSLRSIRWAFNTGQQHAFIIQDRKNIHENPLHQTMPDNYCTILTKSMSQSKIITITHNEQRQ